MPGKLVAVAVGAMLVASAAAAQPKVAQVGYLGSSSESSDKERTAAFRKGLQELGYVEGKNIVVQWRYPEGSAERLPEIAAEFVRMRVRVIVVSGATATRVVKREVAHIPVVMTNVSDPVGLGLVASLAKPGGNLTGLTNVSQELGAKRVQFIRTIAPKATRVGVIGDPTSPAYQPQVGQLKVAAERAGLQLELFEVRNAVELEKAFAAMPKAGIGALIAVQNPTITRLRSRVAELALKNRMPAIYPQAEFVDAGGLASYGTDIPELHRQAASFVDRILKGANPATMPVEQPTKYELAVNARAARQIGIVLPNEMLLQADRVVR